eukprot:CAMPEP_0119091606 /NCGR_PEP_ID=MMETSP1178-20130426/156888_1 /TAXON_ID=33656 /ORGANISM="unid sp, Strain CCMP2000" /LENGTH=38 /DNA_ID= /DNA_START= /DNA_END= /DNA_ORIENTATION=
MTLILRRGAMHGRPILRQMDMIPSLRGLSSAGQTRGSP